MKSASPALIALLASQQYLYAHLFTLTLQSGTVLYYTDADGSLVFGGNTFIGSSPKISFDGCKSTVDITVDTTNVLIYASPISDLISGISFPQFAANGGFDNATVRIDRCFMGSWGDTTSGVVNVFLGQVTGVSPSRTALTLEVSSMLVLLNLQMPRNVYQPGCSHTLFDTGCSLSKVGWGSSFNRRSRLNRINHQLRSCAASQLFQLGDGKFYQRCQLGCP